MAISVQSHKTLDNVLVSRNFRQEELLDGRIEVRGPEAFDSRFGGHMANLLAGKRQQTSCMKQFGSVTATHGRQSESTRHVSAPALARTCGY